MKKTILVFVTIAAVALFGFACKSETNTNNTTDTSSTTMTDTSSTTSTMSTDTTMTGNTIYSSLFAWNPSQFPTNTYLSSAPTRTRVTVRPNAYEKPRWDVTVKMDRGGTRVVSQGYEPLLREGDRVRIFGTQLELVNL